MSTVILVHGAWLNARSWAPVATLLRSKGATVHTPDLLGHGSDPTPLSEISLEGYAHQVIQLADSEGGSVTLVGHSMAGVVISQAAELRPDLFKQLVYISAYLPTAGQSLNDLAQTDAGSQVGPHLRPADDWSTLDIEASARRDLFFHDVDSTLAEEFLSNWKAEPVGPLATPVALTSDRFGSVSRAYVQTLQDRVVSFQLQEKMLQATPGEVHTLDAGHLAILSKADEIALLVERYL